MITKKQIAKLMLDRLGDQNVILSDLPSCQDGGGGGWLCIVNYFNGKEHDSIMVMGPTRMAARAGLNALLFALPRRQRRR